METLIMWWAKFREEEKSLKLWWETKRIINFDSLPNINASDYQYNQLEFAEDFGSCLCTYYAPLAMYSCNNNIEIDRLKRYQWAKNRFDEYDFDENVWWYLDVWVSWVVKLFKDCLYYKIHKSEVLNLVNKWYIVNIWLYAWWDVKKAIDDWNITNEEIDKIKTTKYWHSTLIKKDWWQDSYFWVKKYNVYSIEDNEKFINSWLVYDWAYIIIPWEIIKEVFENKMTWNYKKDTDLWVELMKQKEIYELEFKVYQELLREFYVR